MKHVREREPSLVHAFRQSTPYVNVHRGATFVLMMGGEAICHPNFANIVSDIALLLGFAEQSSFSHAFRDWQGCTPQEYRQRHCRC